MTARRLIASLAVFAVIVAGLGVTIAVLTAHREPPRAAPSPAVPLPSTVPAKPEPRVPTPAEFQVGVVVTEQNCSATTSCVYKYRVEPKYLGLHPLPDKEIKVVYQVTGGNQPQTGDFTVQGGQARVLQDVPLEGPPGARLQASVTQIVG